MTSSQSYGMNNMSTYSPTDYATENDSNSNNKGIDKYVGIDFKVEKTLDAFTNIDETVLPTKEFIEFINMEGTDQLIDVYDIIFGYCITFEHAILFLKQGRIDENDLQVIRCPICKAKMRVITVLHKKNKFAVRLKQLNVDGLKQ